MPLGFRSLKKNNHLCLSIILLSLLLSFLFYGYGLCYDFKLWDQGAIGHDTLVIHAELDEKPLLLYFHVNGEEFCEKMNQTYLAASEVEDYLRDLYKVELDPTRGEDEKALAQRYGVKNYPALLITIPAFKYGAERVHPFYKGHDMGIDEFVRAISEKIAFLYNKRAFSSYSAGQYDEALKYFRRGLDYNPRDPYAYYAMGVIYHTMGRELKKHRYLQEAERMLLRALEIDPDHTESMKELEKLRKDAKSEN